MHRFDRYSALLTLSTAVLSLGVFGFHAEQAISNRLATAPSALIASTGWQFGSPAGGSLLKPGTDSKPKCPPPLRCPVRLD